MPSEIIVVASEDQLRVTIDPSLIYAPAEFHGTIHWPKISAPTQGDPRERLR